MPDELYQIQSEFILSALCEGGPEIFIVNLSMNLIMIVRGLRSFLIVSFSTNIISNA